MNKVMFVSYYTKNTPYEKVMKDNLLPDLKKWNLPYYVREIEDLGSWQANTSYKAQFMLDCLENFKCDCIFIDSDATIEQYPKLLMEIPDDYDMAVHWLDWCYSADTQIYTKDGWKYFYDLKEKEVVATMNPNTQELEYQKVDKIIKKSYNGAMCNFANQQVDLLVTPEHRLFSSPYPSFKNPTIRTAEDLYNCHRFNMRKTCKWKGESVDYFMLPEYQNCYGKEGNLKYEKSEILIPIKLWIKFLAWYLSEGSSVHGQVTVGQKKNTKHSKDIKEMFLDMSTILDCKFSIYDYPGKVLSYNLFSIQLSTYLRKNCYKTNYIGRYKSKFNSHNKSIPNEIKELNTSLLKLFLNTYIKGDGNIHKGVTTVFTVSEQMTKDLEEIIIKVGKSCTTHKQISGFGHPINIINIKKGKNCTIRRKYKSKQKYEGMVYCVSTRNGLVYVRRGPSTACWCGNCLMWRGKPGDRIHLLSGTMVFRYTPNMIKLAKAYVEAVKTGTVWEQQTLQTLVEDRSAKEIRVYSLPAPYCAIVKQDGVTVPEYMCPPCVLHHQASRKLKDRKNWGNA